MNCSTYVIHWVKRLVKKKPKTKGEGELKKGKAGLKKGSKYDLKTSSAQIKHQKRLKVWLKRLLEALSS